MNKLIAWWKSLFIRAEVGSDLGNVIVENKPKWKYTYVVHESGKKVLIKKELQPKWKKLNKSR